VHLVFGSVDAGFGLSLKRGPGLADPMVDRGFGSAACVPTKDRAPLRVAVCVATCRRPDGLARLLHALDAQALPEGLAQLRIVVVDNDPSGSARDVCDEASSALDTPLDYRLEKRPGIAPARNTGLETALPNADCIAFVDDDEIPEPSWLAELLHARERHAADAVTGPCLPRFDSAPPEWIERGGFFARPRHPDGTLRDTAYTHNALVDARALESLGSFFDSRLGLSGGEDNELFGRLAELGHRIVWADRAVVHDCVPADRARLGWILRRAFRVGTTTLAIDRIRGRGASRRIPHGLYCILKGSLLALAGAPTDRARAARGLHLASFGAGLLAGVLGHRAEPYRAAHSGR
jgi:GT2 family glycosyltransferase